MWQAEVLQRQGSWVRRFSTKSKALRWIDQRAKADAESVNPVRRVTLINLDNREPLPPVGPREHSFDDEEHGWKP